MDDGPPGISPMQLLLISLAACTAMDTVSILEKMRSDLESMEVRIDSERAPEHPKVYTRITLHFAVSGEIPEKDLRKAMNLSKERYCSVGAMLEKTAAIEYTYQIGSDGSIRDL
jgi:putative redox protein